MFVSARKRSVVTLLAFIVAFTLVLAACSKNNGNNTASSSPSAAAPSSSAPAASESAPASEADPFAEHLEITILGFGDGALNGAQVTPVQKMLEEEFNVTFKIPPVSVASEEQRNLYFAEGNEADLTIALGQFTTLIDQGVFKELDMADVEKKMPNWIKSLETVLPYELAKSKVSYKGKYYTLPWANYSAVQPFVQMVRQDWLDNLGITTLPATIDEFTELLRKFTFDDPDKNGKNDTYGTSLRIGQYPSNSEYGAYLYGAFGIPANTLAFYADEQGKIYAIATSENRKKMLKQLAAWYKEGIIDPEMVTDTRALQRDKWQAGKFGILSDHPWWFAPSTPTSLSLSPGTVNPAARTSYMTPYTGPDGFSGSTFVNYAPANHAFYIGVNTPQNKIDRILAIQDRLSADDELYIRMLYGEEGVHYDKDADGKIVPKPEFVIPENMAKAGIGEFFSVKPITWDFVQKYTLVSGDKAAYDISMANKYYPDDVNFGFSGQNEALVKYTADLKTMISEFDFRAIRGEIDLDKEWASFTAKFMEMGGREIIDEYQKLHDEAK